MMRYRWRVGNLGAGIAVYVAGAVLGATWLSPNYHGGWVILLTLGFVGLCMATERGEWRWWQKLLMLPAAWVGQSFLMAPVFLVMAPVLAASNSLRGAADLVVALMAGFPIVLFAMRKSRWFVESGTTTVVQPDAPLLWRALGWLFAAMNVLGYIGQGTLFLLIEYAYIRQNWTFIFNPLGYIQTLVTMLTLPTFWLFLAMAVFGYLGVQWVDRRLEERRLTTGQAEIT